MHRAHTPSPKCSTKNIEKTDGLSRKVKAFIIDPYKNWIQSETLSLVKGGNGNGGDPQEKSAQERRVLTTRMRQSAISLNNLTKRPRCWTTQLVKNYLKIWTEVSRAIWWVFLYKGEATPSIQTHEGVLRIFVRSNIYIQYRDRLQWAL